MWKGCEEKPLRGRITVVLEVGNFIQTLNISPPIKTLWLNCIDLILCPFLEWCFKCTANIFIWIDKRGGWTEFKRMLKGFSMPWSAEAGVVWHFGTFSPNISVAFGAGSLHLHCNCVCKQQSTYYFLNWKKGETQQMTRQRLNQRLDFNTNLPFEGMSCRWRHTGVRLMRGGGANEGGVLQVWRENRQREEAEEWHMTHENVNFKIKEEIIKPNHKNHDWRDVRLNLIYRSETPNILCF